MNIKINNKILSQSKYTSQTFRYLHFSMNKIMRLALPVLGMCALSYMSMAEAGSAEYEACKATCWSMATLASVVSLGSIPYELTKRLCETSCRYHLLF